MQARYMLGCQVNMQTDKGCFRMHAGSSLLSQNGRREPGTPKGKDTLMRSLSAAQASLAGAGKRTSPLERLALCLSQVVIDGLRAP